MVEDKGVDKAEKNSLRDAKRNEIRVTTWIPYRKTRSLFR